MLDFNDASVELPPESGATRESLRTDLVGRLESVLATLFPAGKKRKGKFLIGDVLGSPGDSLEVVLDGEKAGLWTDRATGDGGDIFDLIAAHLGADAQTDFPRVLQHAADLLGQSPPAPSRKTKKEAPVDELGPATAKWDYLDAAGKLIAVVYRYDPPGRKKEFRPWDAKRRKMAPPEPRPLYNQPGVALASQVVLVEGEKCAQALIDVGIVATTAMHGANAPVEKTDWSPLAGKSVLIWPDRDKPGWEYATQAAQAILSAGAKSCFILYPPEEAAEGWDAADAIAEGFDVAAFLAHGPRLQMHDITVDAEPVASSDESVWGTEDALALAFTRRYHRDWRYVSTWGRWLVTAINAGFLLHRSLLKKDSMETRSASARKVCWLMPCASQQSSAGDRPALLQTRTSGFRKIELTRSNGQRRIDPNTARSSASKDVRAGFLFLGPHVHL